MNTQSNAMPEASVSTQAVGSSIIAPVRPFYWSVRRELWETRAIYIAPLAVSALILVGSTIGLVLPHRNPEMGMEWMHPQRDPMQHYDICALMFMLTQMLIAVFYCLDSLYGERRDRSILFWKSMPVSDLTTVLSKATIPFVILPLLMCAFIVATESIMFAVQSAAWAAKGHSVAVLYSQVPLLSVWVLVFYHLVAVHTLWHAPFYAWMMLVSAWARRAALLWAILPPLALGFLERIVFGTTYFAHLVGYRFAGGGEDSITAPGAMPIDPMTHLTPLKFLLTPGLWTGFILSAIFLAIAVRLRRSRAPI